jgi:hypothetical protein
MLPILSSAATLWRRGSKFPVSANDRDAAMMSSGPDQQQQIGRDAIGMGAE